MTLIVVAVFAILVIYDLQKFIRNKQPARVYVIYILIMAASMIVALLLAAGKNPPGPSQWIEAALKLIGVVK